MKISTQKKNPPVPPFPKPTIPACCKAQHYEFSTYFLKPFAEDLDLQGLANHLQHHGKFLNTALVTRYSEF